MRALSVPATLVVAQLAYGCSSSVPSDASADRTADAVIDALSDALGDTSDVSDVRDEADATDANDATADASDGPPMVCEGARDSDGGVVCHEENVQGSGLFCIRYLCGADDGGATFDGCCRLVG